MNTKRVSNDSQTQNSCTHNAYNSQNTQKNPENYKLDRPKSYCSFFKFLSYNFDLNNPFKMKIDEECFPMSKGR